MLDLEPCGPHRGQTGFPKSECVWVAVGLCCSMARMFAKPPHTCFYNIYIYIYIYIPLAFGLPATVPNHELVAEALGECRENAAQILIFILWLGHSLEHPKGAKITSKSTQNRPKIIKSWYLGWLWAPLGPPWRHLGHHLGPGCQKPSKK